MIEAAVTYVFQTPEGGCRFTRSRVSLDSIVRAYWEGRSPEAVAEDFPTLSLEQIHGAVAFYLHNREEMDRYLATQDESWKHFQQESEAAHGSLRLCC